MSADYLLTLLVAFFTSWQVKVLGGLIVLDLALALAGALRTSAFDLVKLADFYKVLVLPYVLGYLAVYLVIGFIIPADSLGDLGEPVSQGAVTLAWSTLVLSLLGRIKDNWAVLYGAAAAKK